MCIAHVVVLCHTMQIISYGGSQVMVDPQSSPLLFQYKVINFIHGDWMITMDFMDVSINGFLSHGSSPMTGCFRRVQ